jgi:PDZ domain-containing protein
MALIGLIVTGAVYKLPYYAFRPGSVRDTGRLISVEGQETYPSQGSISYTTVSLGQVTFFKLLAGWIDDDVDIEPQDKVLQGRNSDENKRVNLQLMDTSQQVATQVALEELGYDVPVHIKGQTVLRVKEDFPADGVLDQGDTIVAIGGEPLDDLQDLDRLMGDKHPGDTVDLTVRPFTETPAADEHLSMTLAASPDDANKGVMGVEIVPSGVEFEFPFQVSFDTGEVGGPSAGLAFTLGLIDELTPGELTGGEDVAVTGTINSDGSVGPIGGAGQKAAAVRDAGMDVFLVPSLDYQAAKAHAGDVKVIKVDTLDEALAALAELGGNGLALPALGPEQPAGGA